MKRLSRERRNSAAPLDAEPSLDVRITLLGSGGVGKSALAVRFLCRRFLGEYDPTLEDTYAKTMLLDGKLVHMSIVDTAGEITDDVYRQQQCIGADAVIIVFSLTDRLTFDDARERLALVARWARDAINDGLRSRTRGLVALLVGNKSDLRRHREVTSDEASRLAAEFGIGYAETSASDDRPSVDRAFMAVVDSVRSIRRASPSHNGGSPGSSTGSSGLSSRRSSIGSGSFDGQLVALRDRLAKVIPVGAH